ncbi:unnamed protein product, partial [marine sediment metagenome]
DISIEIEDSGSTYPIKVGEDWTSLPATLQSRVESARASNFILRRYMLLRFITDDPADRYSAIGSFLNLDPFIPIENGLKSWIDRLSTSKARYDSELNAVALNIRTVYNIDSVTEISSDELLRILNTRLRETNLPICSVHEEANERLKSINAELGGTTVSQRLEKLASLKAQVQRLSLPRNLEPLLTNVIEALKELETERKAKTGPLLTELLLDGQKAIVENKLTSCP